MLSSKFRIGFTLVELLVVIAIIGVLTGLLLPAVQMAREASRRASCLNNIKNTGLALHNFHGAQNRLPAGSELLNGTEHSWATHILPFQEQSALWSQIDFRQKWNAETNLHSTQTMLPIYRCPSAVQNDPGQLDYGGVMGTSLLPLPLGNGPNDAFGCGTLIVTSRAQPRGVLFASCTDGLSTTLAVAESVDRDPESAGRWACGRNCLSQNSPSINHGEIGEFRSRHPTGANGLFADGHVTFLSENIDSAVLGAVCSRNGGESVVLLDQ